MKKNGGRKSRETVSLNTVQMNGSPERTFQVISLILMSLNALNTYKFKKIVSRDCGGLLWSLYSRKIFIIPFNAFFICKT
jgi:hypothetical protein